MAIIHNPRNRRRQKRRNPTVRDEEQELLLSRSTPIELSDEEYQPGSETEETVDEVLEYVEEEEIIFKLTEAKAKAILSGKLDPQEAHDMVLGDEQEPVAISGRRRGSVAGTQPTSTAKKARTRSPSPSPSSGKTTGAYVTAARPSRKNRRAYSRSISPDHSKRRTLSRSRSPTAVKRSLSATSIDDEKDDYGNGDGSTHNKRSRAGRNSASAKVGDADSDTVMESPKHMVTGGLADRTPSEEAPLPPPDSLDVPAPEKLLLHEDGKPKYELGTVLWRKVFSYFYLSELSAFATVNKEWRANIYHLPLWQEICEKTGLALGPSDLVKYGYKRPDYYRLAHENSDSICENRFELTRSSGSGRALPVKLNGADVPGVRMCLDCRRDYYSAHPEPYPDHVKPQNQANYKIVPRVTVDEAEHWYLLKHGELHRLNRVDYSGYGGLKSMILYNEQDVLGIARQKYGGDIGIAALRADSKISGRKAPEHQDDEKRHRWNYLRSMLHDKGLKVPEKCVVAHNYIEQGLGDPFDIVKKLEVINWFHCCTTYKPKFDIDKVMTDKEKEKDDRFKMIALEGWLLERLERENYCHWSVDSDDSAKPPDGVWPLLKKIDWGQILLKFAADNADLDDVLATKEVGDFRLTKQHLRELLDSSDQGGTERKGPKLSTLLEHEVGKDWSDRVLKKVKESY
ncbi:MAG: hypothetical protein J3Q66DRAFT_62630 [Benniella sp.]|nr:MAG: hypothetical protein J3Q66DRAFT_62630 [Benniella sp.]